MRQEQWLKTRKDLLESVKSQVNARLGPPPRSLRAYSRKLDEEFERPWKKSSSEELLQACHRADLLFLGDFHAYYQSQRAHLRLLRQLDLSQTTLFLECFRVEDAQILDLFWKGRISESEFLKRVRWDQVWGFPWEHYRDLILFLREKQVVVRGLSAGSFYDLRLKARDRKMAQIIEETLLENPSQKVIVIAGEKHLFKGHLPQEVKKRPLLLFRHEVTVFQDNEVLYFRFQKKSKTWEPSVLRKKNSFCWNVSPPWVKWQSYLIYLEKTSDQELEDDDLDYEDHIKAFILWMCQDLQLRVSCNRLEVVTPKSAMNLKTSIPSPILKELISSERSFLLDAQGKIYLSRPSVNHAAAVAGKFIHNQLSGRKKIFYDLPNHLERRLWIETVGFFFSKWMNPSRKTEAFEDLQIRLGSLDSKKTSSQTMKLVSEIFVHGQRIKQGRRSRIKRGSLERCQELSQLEAIRFLGRIFGKALFERVLSLGVSRDELQYWLQLPLEDQDFPKTFWEKIVPRLV